MRKSIRLRVILTYLLLILAVMVATGIILLNMLENYYLSSEEETLERTGRLAADLIQPYLREEPDPVFLSSLAENFSHQLDARVIFIDPGYRVIGDSERIGGLLGTRLEREEVEEALAGNTGRSVQYSQSSEQWVLQVAVPVEEADESLLGAVFLSASLEPVYETLTTVRRFLLLSTAVALGLAGGLGVLLAHHLTDPIKELTQAAQQMAEGKLDQHISVPSEDEIGRLAEQFNIMASRVKEMNERLTRFVADVSHELRTPLASLLACIQSLQSYDMEPEEREEFLKDLNSETQRLIYLVEDLLELTRRSEVPDHREVVSARGVLDEVIPSAMSRAQRNGLEFYTSLDNELPPLSVSAEALKRVLFNLLDNSMKYTQPGGWILLSATRDKDYIRFSVQDTGYGIPEDELPHIFERFYRVDKARSRHLGGTGLGLSICKEIVEHYGGKIWVESREGEGSTFSFTLPAQPSPPEETANVMEF